MAIFERSIKRVRDPLDEKAKACMRGKDDDHRQQMMMMNSQFSSGSEHDGEDDLSDLVRSFIEDDARENEKVEKEADSDNGDVSEFEMSDAFQDLLMNRSFVAGKSDDTFVFVLRSHVLKAVELFSFSSSSSSSSSCLRSNNKGVLRRNVMAYLRESGYNAGICKTKWQGSGGLTAGNYEFIDVVQSSSAAASDSSSEGFARQQRYIVDVDFAGEFEIARPTAQYVRLLQVLPRVYVGRSEEMKHIVRLMCDAAKKSLKRRELHLPPWRKNRFMQSKWFGPYRRTVNLVQSTGMPVRSTGKPVRFDELAAVKCRSVGFNAVNGRLVLPATTRTR